MTSQDDMKGSLEHGGQSSSSVVISLNDKLDAISSSPPEYTIFKVHELLRRENEMAYEPEILAIGPYHRGKPRLQVMEDRKLHWFKAYLERLGESDANIYIEALKSLEPEARQCYSESTSHVNANDFVEMMLLDGCFMIQFMRMRWFSDPFFEDWVIGSLIRDMIIFENQIPLFVLEELFSVMKLPDEEFTHFHEFVSVFLNNVLRAMFSDTIPTNLTSVHDSHHLLGFLHDLLCSLAVGNDNTNLADDDPSINNNTNLVDDVPSINNNETSNARWNFQHAMKLCEAGFKFIITRPCSRGRFDQQDRELDDFPDAPNHMLNIESIPSATKLHAAGVQFKSKNDGSSPFEISFKKGVMEIPIFSISDLTESFYRNLIAYEQYNQKSSDRCVVLHAKFMDCLIDSAQDVALLRKFGILVNILGDDETVSSIFNKLGNHVCVSNRDSEVHYKLFEEVNAYCGKRRHKWMAKLRRDYFNSPWALISFFAALFLLVLTLTQTVFSILGVLWNCYVQLHC